MRGEKEKGKCEKEEVKCLPRRSVAKTGEEVKEIVGNTKEKT